MIVLFATALLGLILSVVADTISDEYIDSINKQNLSWTAKRYFPKDVTLSQLRGRLGAVPGPSRSSLRLAEYSVIGYIPDRFDAREKWSSCSSLKEIRDQANCGSCWAFAATEAMTDRICIHSNATKQISVSAQDLLSCCIMCGDGCNGGEPAIAWLYWNHVGIVSGGLYNSRNGCRSYSIAPCDHHVNGTLQNCSAIIGADTPECLHECDAGTHLTYTSELTFGQEPYMLSKNVTSIQWEILTNGPVEAEFDVYDDFLVYSKGIYRKSIDAKVVGAHDVKIIGWGVEKNTPYWLIANSWNVDWGEKGFFRILRGTNECGIEDYIVAGLPEPSNSSDTSRIGTVIAIFALILCILHY